MNYLLSLNPSQYDLSVFQGGQSIYVKLNKGEDVGPSPGPCADPGPSPGPCPCAGPSPGPCAGISPGPCGGPSPLYPEEAGKDNDVTAATTAATTTGSKTGSTTGSTTTATTAKATSSSSDSGCLFVNAASCSVHVSID